VELPESPDTCSHLVDTLESEISKKVDDLIALQNCNNFNTNTVCSALGEQVTQIIEDNTPSMVEISGRVADILLDILAVTDNEEEDHI
jgi:hypothetical protein